MIVYHMSILFLEEPYGDQAGLEGELQRLYQLPFSMDATLIDTFKVNDMLPFSQAALCVIFTSVMRQLSDGVVGLIGI